MDSEALEDGSLRGLNLTLYLRVPRWDAYVIPAQAGIQSSVILTGPAQRGILLDSGVHRNDGSGGLSSSAVTRVLWRFAGPVLLSVQMLICP
jgi:hypothetical protein